MPRERTGKREEGRRRKERWSGTRNGRSGGYFGHGLFSGEGGVGHDGLSDESKRGPAGPLKKEDFNML